MKRKNLEKAIILGLMAAGISVPAWADNTISGPLWTDANKTVEEGNLIVDAGKTVGIGFQGTVNVKNGNLTVNSDSNGILAGYAKDATVNILANNITINSGENGIFTTWGDSILDILKGYSGNVNIGSSDGKKVDSLYINASGQGIDNKLGNVNIYGSKDSIISIKTDSTGGKMENQDGILNESGQVVIEGGNVIISADYGYGINNNSTKVDIDAAGSVSIVSKDIPIDGKDPIVNAGINNTKGITEITAEQGITVESTHNGIYATGGTVKFNGGTQNKINAVDYGIYATGKNTQVTLSAENHEIYVNNNSGEPDGIAKGVYVSDGATKEIVSEGNTTIVSEGNVRDIIGIHADAGGTVDINTGSLNIEATANDANVDNYLSGILAGDINQNVDTDKATVIADVDGDIRVDIYSAGTDSYGIKTNNNGNVKLTSHEGDIKINAIDNVEAYTGATKYGVHTGIDGQTTLVSENGSISVNAGDSETYRGNNHGITNYGEILIDAKEDVSINSYSYGDSSGYSSGIDTKYGITTINAGGNFVLDSISNIDTANSKNYGAQLSGQGKIDIDAANVVIKSKGNISYAVYEWGTSNLNIDAVSNNEINGIIGIQAEAGSGEAIAMFIDSSTAELNADNDIIIKATSAEANATGAYVNKSIVELNSENGSTFIISQGTNDVYGIRVQTSTEKNSEMTVTSAVNNYVESSGTGIASWYDNSVVNLTAETGSNQVQANGIGIYNYGGAQANMTAGNGFNTVSSQTSAAIQNNGAGGSVSLQAQGNSLEGYNAIVSYGGNIDLNAATVNNELTVDGYGIYAVTKADVDLTAENGMNYLKSGNFGIGIYADDSTVDLQAEANTLSIAMDDKGYGSKHSIQAANKATVNLNATAGDNVLAGVIYAKDEGTSVTLNHMNGTDTGSGSNYIYSSAHGSTDGVSDRSSVVAALYAQNQGQIDIVAGEGGINHIETLYSDIDKYEDGSERTVWAQRGGIINIEGTTIIKSSNAEDFYEEGYATNSLGVAITAGSGVNLDDPEHGYEDAAGVKHAFYDKESGILANVDDVLGYRSEVNLNYGAGSSIYGDVVSGYGGLVDISKANENSGLYMEGNALAANGGKLTIDIGKGGTWFGRADDYGDAGYGEEAANKQNFYNPVFTDTIYTGGTVDIKMGEGSTWYLTGQSWVSSLDVTEGKGNVTIDMERFNEGTHGLTISELKGENGNGVDATFVMDLDHNSHSTSDMLYIKNATGEYDVVLNNVIDGMEKINEDNVLRFATVHGGASFNSVTMNDAGLYNLGFEIGHSEYDTAAVDENKGYNDSGSNEEGDYETIGTNKPGNTNVEGFFFDQNNDNEDSTRKIMLLDEIDTAADDPNSVQNWYITKVLGQELSDGGKTVVNMSKVNYSNAVYMDRLNKRLGEARYINPEEDQGMWVRMRHDRIGKDNEFRIMNTMYELGYDEKQECDNGERRVGAAIDYMDGSSEYTGVGGSGDVSRKGIWLYDTWLGDKGHYSDFVAKWGHLSNDFTLYRGGDKITGDFSNNVYSISAEYGRKKDIGNNWYFEPQVQLQYARVTDANYTTSQGTEVSLDAINSLIARAGFRLGKDLGERSTVYFKADLLHEFLGDQDIYATDGTGSMDVTYGNEGTWCDIGFGFATAVSKTSYAYLDVETSLGNDYEETYQINAGLQWSF